MPVRRAPGRWQSAISTSTPCGPHSHTWTYGHRHIRRRQHHRERQTTAAPLRRSPEGHRRGRPRRLYRAGRWAAQRRHRCQRECGRDRRPDAGHRRGTGPAGERRLRPRTQRHRRTGRRRQRRRRFRPDAGRQRYRCPHPPPPPPPPASAAPKPKPLDQDRDGLPDAREEQARGITGPDGAVTGDGNGDGIPDKTQSAVASTQTVTLVAGSRDGKLGPDSLARITSLEHKAGPAQLPPEMEMPVGLLSFSAAPGAAGRSESFSLYVDPAQGANGYWIEDDTGIWVNLASAPYGGKMVTEGGRLRLDFQIEDGGRFDADGKADGAITALGAAAYMPLSIIGKRPEDQALDFWF